ncbi:hypothetical protein MKX01_034414 [Papaver californicum]|nr:hypothetical protein MKX01_034414 [Papaver californicum]
MHSLVLLYGKSDLITDMVLLMIFHTYFFSRILCVSSHSGKKFLINGKFLVVTCRNRPWFVKEINTPNHFGGIGYLGFENITFIPIQVKLVELSLMSAAEVDWLNDYHSQVWKKVSPLVEGAASKWLRDNTQPLVKP